MAMPLCSVSASRDAVVPSFFMDDGVRTIRADGWERTYDLNKSGSEPFVVIVCVWPDLHKALLKAKDCYGKDFLFDMHYVDSDYDLVYDQLHRNWFVLENLIKHGYIKSL
jgi:hypothetical protein